MSGESDTLHSAPCAPWSTMRQCHAQPCNDAPSLAHHCSEQGESRLPVPVLLANSNVTCLCFFRVKGVPHLCTPRCVPVSAPVYTQMCTFAFCGDFSEPIVYRQRVPTVQRLHAGPEKSGMHLQTVAACRNETAGGTPQDLHKLTCCTHHLASGYCTVQIGTNAHQRSELCCFATKPQLPTSHTQCITDS